MTAVPAEVVANLQVTSAATVGSTRQKVNYHLKALEAHGLVEPAEEGAWGGTTERLVRRSAFKTQVFRYPGSGPNR